MEIEELIFMAESIKTELFHAGQKMESGPGRVLVLKCYNYAAYLLGALANVQRDTPESWNRTMKMEPDDPGRAL